MDDEVAESKAPTPHSFRSWQPCGCLFAGYKCCKYDPGFRQAVTAIILTSNYSIWISILFIINVFVFRWQGSTTKVISWRKMYLYRKQHCLRIAAWHQMFVSFTFLFYFPPLGLFKFIDCHRKNKYNIFKWRLNSYIIITYVIINARNILRERWFNYQEDFLIFQMKMLWFQAHTHSSEAPVTPRGMTSFWWMQTLITTCT